VLMLAAEFHMVTSRTLGAVTRPLLTTAIISLGVPWLLQALGRQTNIPMWQKVLVGVSGAAATEAALYTSAHLRPEVRARYVAWDILRLYRQAAADPEVEERLIEAAVESGFERHAIEAGIFMAKQAAAKKAAKG